MEFDEKLYRLTLTQQNQTGRYSICLSRKERRLSRR